jgi:glycosyltransferase involved in cell wall biosynthesis
MKKYSLSVTIIAHNEAHCIERALKSVSWADEILVVDSGSTDGTRSLARSLGARVIEHPWMGYGKQKNHAQTMAKHDWILNLDADEWVPDSLALEIQKECEHFGSNSCLGFLMPRKTFYWGKWIRHGGWYPNYVLRLGNRTAGCWTEPELHERWEISGPVKKLDGALHHLTFEGVRDQVLTNIRYAQAGAMDLARKGERFSPWKLVWKSLGKFLESYVLKRGFLDGLAGFVIAVNAAHSMFMKYAFLFEQEKFPRAQGEVRSGGWEKAVHGLTEGTHH